MLRFFTPLICLSLLTLTFLNITARVLGTAQPSNPGLDGFSEGCQDKPQPCWYGIVPGITTRREVTRITQSQGYEVQNEIFSGSFKVYSIYNPPPTTQGCQLEVGYGPRGEVVDFSLEDCEAIRLGDIIRLYGSEAAVFVNPDGNSLLLFSGAAFRIAFSFGQGMHPFSRITDIKLFPLSVRFDDGFGWHGFAGRRRYCQFEPGHLDCSKAAQP